MSNKWMKKKNTGQAIKENFHNYTTAVKVINNLAPRRKVFFLIYTQNEWKTTRIIIYIQIFEEKKTKSTDFVAKIKWCDSLSAWMAGWWWHFDDFFSQPSFVVVSVLIVIIIIIIIITIRNDDNKLRRQYI